MPRDARAPNNCRLTLLGRNDNNRAIANIELADAQLAHHRQRIRINLHAVQITGQQSDDLDSVCASMLDELGFKCGAYRGIKRAVFVVNEVIELARYRTRCGQMINTG